MVGRCARGAGCSPGGARDAGDCGELGLEPGGADDAGAGGVDALVVVATGGRPVSSLPADLPSNVRAASFLPYDQLLPLTDLMVTNGGYGGVHYALEHGVRWWSPG